jgi:hypothetical protein
LSRPPRRQHFRGAISFQLFKLAVGGNVPTKPPIVDIGPSLEAVIKWQSDQYAKLVEILAELTSIKNNQIPLVGAIEVALDFDGVPVIGGGTYAIQ